MRHPFEYLPGLVLFGVGVFAAALLIVGTWLMARPGRTMKDLGCSVIGFELAGSTVKLTQILARWGTVGKAAARQSLLVDSFLYVPGYALLTSVIAAGSADEVGRRVGGCLAEVTRVAAYAALAAGVLDGMENTSLAMVLKGELGFGQVARSVAIIKFMLIGSAVAWVLLVTLPIVAAPGL